MKKTSKRILGVSAALVGILLIAALCWSFAICYRTLHPPRLTDTEWVTEQYPHISGWLDSIRRNGLLHDAVRTNVRGEQLHALWLRAPEPTKRTAVLIHGYGGNAQTMLMIGYLYNRELGYNILLPDLRGHGLSEPKAIGMGWNERAEVLDWIRTADSLFGGNTRMLLHGVSMGAATTMIAAGEETLPTCVRCAVEDCGYTSSRDIFAYAWKKDSPMPLFPLFQLSDLWCRILYGWGFAEASPLEAMHRSRLPMLFIHGDRDSVVPVEMVHRLYEAKTGDKELWILPGVDHGAAYLHDPQEYTRRIRTFVEPWIECPLTPENPES